MNYEGGCHCGAVRFEVEIPDNVEVGECNCSICFMGGYLHLIVPKKAFRLVKGEDAITTYQFGTRVAQHSFCSHCGIKSFYVPRSHPEGVSINARCLSVDALSGRKTREFDGRNWRKNAHQIRPLPLD